MGYWISGISPTPLVSQRDHDLVQVPNKGEGIVVDPGNLGAGVLPNVKGLRQGIRADVHPGHILLGDLFAVDIQLTGSSERFGFNEVELQLRLALFQRWRHHCVVHAVQKVVVVIGPIPFDEHREAASHAAHRRYDPLLMTFEANRRGDGV